ncbi:yjbH outer membrane lipoprotein [Vibrio ishigakensis]|uniref:YjbH outer membrane lipoprotein n=1 Tax=Vibrio ishigakensis TaxID=1481914 RepID=A0A0B8P2X2_9VIBR|nr:yjbH outer membrane lipoprotein [Vibrio ishigakensis]
MQMPTGRMAREGQFSFNGTWNNEYHWYSISLQVMPWLEASIRYTLVQDLLYSGDPDFSDDNELADKGIDFKVRLLKESRYIPEVSLGFRDFGGTGLFDGEFLAATKRFGPLDATVGIGWGYLGQSGNISNPMCSIADRFCTRPQGFSGNGGQFDADRWFTGPASIYAGIEYQTPFQPLSIKVEYDTNDYSQDAPVVRGRADMTQHIPVNFGLVYKHQDWAHLRMSYERGDTFTAGLTLTTNFNDLYATWLDEPEPELRPNGSNKTTDYSRLAQDLYDVAGYKVSHIELEQDTLVVVAEQSKYRDRTKARYRASTVIANHSPESIKSYHIIETKESLAVTQAEIDRQSYLAYKTQQSLDADFSQGETSYPVSRRTGLSEYEEIDRFDYAFSPQLVQSFGSAESFYLYSIGVNAEASFWLTRNLQASGSLYLNLIDNYDKFNYIAPPDGTDVPRVRTLFRAYVDESALRMNNLQLTWFEDFGDNWFFQGYGGYLETMFAGVGAEVLYRPINASWAIGADFNFIAQRDPESWFGVFEDSRQFSEADQRYYNVVDKGTTSFLTAYYMPQWSWLDDTLLKVGAGEFLAGDIGARIDFSKQFDSGVIAGVFASITDLTPEEYGEGSFTKGFYISVPFDVMTVKPSGNRASFSWQPITRDGGRCSSASINCST